MKGHKHIYHLYKKTDKRNLIILIAIAIVALAFSLLAADFNKSVPPNTMFFNNDISGKNRHELEHIVEQEIEKAEKRTFVVRCKDEKKEYKISELGISIGEDQTIEQILSEKQDFLNYLSSFFEDKVVNPIYAVDNEILWGTIYKDFGHFEDNPKNAEFAFSTTNLIVLPSADGILIDKNKLASDIKNVVDGKSSEIDLVLVPTKADIESTGSEQARTRVMELLKIQANFRYGQDVWTLNNKRLFEMLKFLPEGQTDDNFLEVNLGKDVLFANAGFGELSPKKLDVALDKDKVEIYLVDIQSIINKPARDATLRFEGGKVIQFTSAQDGQELNLEETQKRFHLKLKENLASQLAAINVELPVKVTKAKIANQEINSLGIKELIGSGVSYFAGSIANRVHNIELGSSLINGTLIAPGENFSFIELVGPVSADQGFKSAYVIKSGRTVLDDGGGICQVSTTVFRAALNSGLPIVKRTAHAYRVSYYEQRGYKAGMDATIFSPTVDLQFKNDTNQHILVQTVVDRVNARLQVDIYGTGDGRRVELSEPVISNLKPAPEPKYEDDPTLPKGTVKQVDFAAAGATSVFNRKVFKGEQLIIDDTFKSVYRPWQAVFLVGTAG